MSDIIKVKAAKVWTTSDGQTFDSKDKALKHQAEINLRAWFSPYVDNVTAAQIADGIASDPDGFREVVGAILKKPRRPRGSKAAEKRAA